MRIEIKLNEWVKWENESEESGVREKRKQKTWLMNERNVRINVERNDIIWIIEINETDIL